MSIYQLRSIAASLEQTEESEVKVQEETEAGMTEDPEVAQNDDEDSQELRAHALRALLLARQRKRSDTKDTKSKTWL